MPIDSVDIEACIASSDIRVTFTHRNDNLLSWRSFGSHFNFRFDYIWFVDDIVDLNNFLKSSGWKHVLDVENVFDVNLWSLSIKLFDCWFSQIDFLWLQWILRWAWFRTSKHCFGGSSKAFWHTLLNQFVIIICAESILARLIDGIN